MLIISGTTIPENKRVEIALTYIYGIGRKSAVDILTELNLDRSLRVKDLSSDQIIRIRGVIDQYKTGGDLKAKIRSDIKRLVEIGCYRGTRHIRHLPCRGQRTHTNSRTVRRCSTV